MDINQFVNDRPGDSSAVLAEYESKRFLASFGLPMVKEYVVRTEAEIAAALAQLRFPIVLKGHGQNFLHKTELGLVRTGIASADALSQALAEMRSRRIAGLDEFLIQEQVSGKRELVAGMFRDPQFGPMIMLGIGGIFTEAYSDVVFRLAPLTGADLDEMIESLRTRAIFGAFRGEQPIDREALAAIVTALATIGLELPEISEIDMNPLLITPQGQPVCVDALVIRRQPDSAMTYPPPIDPAALGKCFHPRSIAFIGASSQIGKWGHMLPTLTISRKFKGKIYLVNPKAEVIAGRQVYPSVADLPEKVDLGIVTIPAAKVIDLIPQFREKGIPSMLLISSGFSETGQAGKAIEEKLVAEARKAGIVILGPNTMGIINPHVRFYCIGSHVWPKRGATAIVSQSGNMGTQLLAFAEKQHIGVRGFSGSGNEAMVCIEDYLEAFEGDELTKIILLYLESIKNGRRFFESAKRISMRKPIILLKGGQTQSGSNAARSHTGAMAVDSRVFDAVCQQAGIIKVEHPMDMLDLSAAFSAVPLPKGNRAAIMTLGGGWGVLAADMCEANRLAVPSLPPELVSQIDTLLPEYWSRSNPVDLVGEFDNQVTMTVTEALIRWDGCDALINLGIHGRNLMLRRMINSIKRSDVTYSHDFLRAIDHATTEFEKHYIEFVVSLMEKYQKPIYGVSLFSNTRKTLFQAKGKHYQGLFYPTPERAVKVCAAMYRYYQFKTGKQQQ